MALIRTVIDDVRGEQYRLAAALGALSIPVTLLLNWRLASPGDPLPNEITPVVLACVLSGFLFGVRRGRSGRAGAVTALVGGAPVVLWEGASGFVEFASYRPIVEALGSSWLAAAAATPVVLFGAAFLSAVLFVIGTLCGGSGGWLRKQIRSLRPRRAID